MLCLLLHVKGISVFNLFFFFSFALYGSQSFCKVCCDTMDPLVDNIKREEGSGVPLCLVTRESSVPLPSPAVSGNKLSTIPTTPGQLTEKTSF